VKQIQFVNEIHKIIILDYMQMIFEYVQEVSTKEKQKDFEEIVLLLIEYHNSYNKDKHSGNWLDFLYLIPVNLSLITQGYLSALKTKSNKDKINTYKFMVSAKLEEVVSKLNEIKPINE
jgi:hypothetical protein